MVESFLTWAAEHTALFTCIVFAISLIIEFLLYYIGDKKSRKARARLTAQKR